MSLDEEKAKVRNIAYRVAAVASVAGPLLAVALKEGGVSNWVALAVAIVSSLVGGAGSALASRKTRQQINNGTFADSVNDPVQVVLNGLRAIDSAAQAAEAAKATVTQAVTTAAQSWTPPSVGSVEEALADALRQRSPQNPI